MHSASEPDWQDIRPVLDEVVGELSEVDRDAVVLRFFHNKSLRDVGTSIGLTENAARMRVDRALEKLQHLLGERGIKSSGSALSACLIANTIKTAPASLTPIIVETARLTATKTALAITKLKVAAGLAVVTAAAISIPLFISSKTSDVSGFGPVIERMVNSDDPKYGNNVIDFDSGQLPQLPPKSERPPDDPALLLWKRKMGIDATSQVFAWKDAGGATVVAPGMLGYDMVTVAVGNEQWNKISASEIRQRLKGQKTSTTYLPNGRSTTLSSIGGKDGLPLTYLFQTREGGIGILQITGYTDRTGKLGIHPRGVTFRYKLAK
jgi:hypothetical protein